MALRKSTDIPKRGNDIPPQDGSGIELCQVAGNIYESSEDRDRARDTHAYSTTIEAEGTTTSGTHNVDIKVQSNDTAKRGAFSSRKVELTMCQFAVAILLVCTLICTITGFIVYYVVNARIAEIERHTTQNLEMAPRTNVSEAIDITSIKAELTQFKTDWQEQMTVISKNNSESRANHDDLNRHVGTLDSVVDIVQDTLETVQQKRNTSEMASLEYQATIDRRLVTVEAKHNASEMALLDSQASIDRRLSALDSVVETVQETVTTVQEKQTISVAFTAHGATGSLYNTVLTFNNVILNAGDGYNKTTGRFRCPVAGTYLFSATLRTVETRSSLTYCHIRKNGSGVVVVSSSDGNYDTASVSVLVRLSVGDLVDLGSCYNVEEIFTVSGRTVFIGFLIQAE